MSRKRIILYVQSTKTVVGTQEFESIRVHSGMTRASGGAVAGTTRTGHIEYEYLLSDEQEKIIKAAKDMCNEYGFELKIVDVTREDVLHRMIHDNIKGIDIYPALLSDSGRWVEDITSKRQVESFLSKEKETWF
jgi:hypothetical protein